MLRNGKENKRGVSDCFWVTTRKECHESKHFHEKMYEPGGQTWLLGGAAGGDTTVQQTARFSRVCTMAYFRDCFQSWSSTFKKNVYGQEY